MYLYIYMHAHDIESYLCALITDKLLRITTRLVLLWMIATIRCVFILNEQPLSSCMIWFPYIIYFQKLMKKLSIPWLRVSMCMSQFCGFGHPGNGWELHSIYVWTTWGQCTCMHNTDLLHYNMINQYACICILLFWLVASHHPPAQEHGRVWSLVAETNAALWHIVLASMREEFCREIQFIYL